MWDVQKLAVDRIIKQLDAMDAKYLIRFPDGTEFNTLPLPEEEKKSNGPRMPRGTYKPIYDPVLATLDVGECREVMPPEGMSLSKLANIFSGGANARWGSNSLVTHINSKKGVVEIMRVGK